MPKYIARYNTQVEVAVTIEAEDEEAADYAAWELAEEYARTVWGNKRDIVASMSFDGVGATEVEEVD